MAYERMLSSGMLAYVGAAVAVNGYQPISAGQATDYSKEDLDRFHHIDAYLRRCINAGAIPSRRWPLFGIEPDPMAPISAGWYKIEEKDLWVTIKDFGEWIKRSGVQAPETWADVLSESIEWDENPIEGTQVVTGTPKGRPPKLPDNEQLQKEANDLALELYGKGQRTDWRERIGTILSGRYNAEYKTVKDRFKVRTCMEFIKTKKQLKQ